MGRGSAITTNLPAGSGTRPPSTLSHTARRAAQYARDAKARNARRAYAADLAHFRAFCGEHGLLDLPAEPSTIGLYLT
jgi:hypothetical protein